MACDIGDLTTHATLLDGHWPGSGRLDLLVNDAGVLKPHFTLRVSPAELDQIIAVNLKGPLFLSIAAMPHLEADGGGSIVNIGALGASQPDGGHRCVLRGQSRHGELEQHDGPRVGGAACG